MAEFVAPPRYGLAGQIMAAPKAKDVIIYDTYVMFCAIVVMRRSFMAMPESRIWTMAELDAKDQIIAVKDQSPSQKLCHDLLIDSDRLKISASETAVCTPLAMQRSSF